MGMEMRTVKASEFTKNADKVADMARNEPVTVTVGGKPSVVIISADYFDRLRVFEARATTAQRTIDLPQRMIERMRKADLSHLPDN